MSSKVGKVSDPRRTEPGQVESEMEWAAREGRLVNFDYYPWAVCTISLKVRKKLCQSLLF